jgi:hypothetical protein
VIGFYLDDAIPVPGAKQIKLVSEQNNDPLNNRWEKVTDRNIDLFNSSFAPTPMSSATSPSVALAPWNST